MGVIMKSGFLVIDKKQGITSFDVIRFCRKQLGTKKVGHTGTLDPMTTGVLVLAIGNATKYIPIMGEDKQKVYRAQITFGQHRSTYDLEGEILQEEIVDLDSDTVRATIASMQGSYMQYPPIYSAKKVNGKRLYEYARQHQEVEIKPNLVEIIYFNYIGELVDNQIEFEVVVSKGTYIRSLIVDIATKLGTVAYMSELRRLESDNFTIREAIEEEAISEDKIIDLNNYLQAKYPSRQVHGKIENLIRNGTQLKPLPNQQYPLLYVGENGKPLALYQKVSPEQTKPMLMLKDEDERN